MPQLNGVLTAEERALAGRFLEGRGRNRLCGLCGTESWIVGPGLETVPGFGAGPSSTYLPVMCRGCGNTLHLNAAVVLAPVPQEAPEQKPSDAAAPEAAETSGEAAVADPHAPHAPHESKPPLRLADAAGGVEVPAD